MPQEWQLTYIEDLVSKLSFELDELKNIKGNSQEVKKAIVIKEQQIKELMEYLEKKKGNCNH